MKGNRTKIMGYLVAAVVIFLGCYKQNSKIVTYIIAFYMWSLIAFNIGTSDYYAFEEMFYYAFEARYANHEPGFLFLCQVMNRSGFTFLQFRMVIAGIIVFLFLEGMRPFTRHLNYALALFLIFPFGGTVSGLRHSMAVSIIVFFIRYIFIEKKSEVLKYILGVMLATLFHYSAIIYLLFLLARGKRLILPGFAVLTTFIFTGIIFFFKTGVAYGLIRQVINSPKVLNWLKPENFSYRTSPLYIVSLMLFCGVMCLLYLCRSMFTNQKEVLVPQISSSESVNIMIKIEMLSTISVALSILSSVVFMRIAVTVLPVVYAILSEGFEAHRARTLRVQNQNRMIKIVMPMLAFVTALFAYGYWISTSFLTVYQNNMIFGKIR